MQSTATVICRAFVMIFCLVTIPLAAVFGTSLPDIIKALGWGGTSISAREDGGEAPLFAENVPEAATRPDAPAGGFQHGNLQAGKFTTGPKGWPKAQTSMPSAGMQAMQASFSEPAPAYARSGNIAIATSDVQTPDKRPLVPVDVASPATDRYALIQQRLRGLGATYFRLESYGSAGQIYRFQCEMPIGGDGAVRHFEATSVNSLEAMERVLADIDTWLKNG